MTATAAETSLKKGIHVLNTLPNVGVLSTIFCDPISARLQCINQDRDEGGFQKAWDSIDKIYSPNNLTSVWLKFFNLSTRLLISVTFTSMPFPGTPWGPWIPGDPSFPGLPGRPRRPRRPCGPLGPGAPRGPRGPGTPGGPWGPIIVTETWYKCLILGLSNGCKS